MAAEIQKIRFDRSILILSVTKADKEERFKLTMDWKFSPYTGELAVRRVKLEDGVFMPHEILHKHKSAFARNLKHFHGDIQGVLTPYVRGATARFCFQNITDFFTGVDHVR